MPETDSSTVGDATEGTAVAVPWLLGTKVAAPKPADAYVSRPRLLARYASGCGCVIVQAPGGFGKTSLLAEIHRRELGRGVLAAWLSLDEDDTEEDIVAYLGYAFERAGLDMPSASASVEHGLAAIVRSIEAYGQPCLLVLDEVERVGEEAAAVLGSLLRHRPRNLHVAMGMRENPGLDLASVAIDGPGLVLTADDLRFSRQEAIDLFGGELSPGKMAELVARAEGWPFALRLYCNMRSNRTAGDETVAANWLGAGLLRNIARDERDFLLDLSLFDLIDCAFADQVLGRTDSIPRTSAMLSLHGLLQPMGGHRDTLRLHPLLKEYCAARLRREDPDRYRRLHRDIAVASERNGHLLASVRHADAAGDSRLVGDILTRAGGLRLYLREGSAQLAGIEQFLTPEVLDGRPLLALLRCRILVSAGGLAEARNLYESVRAETQGFARDPNGDSAHALRVDAAIMAASLVSYGCMPVTDELIRDMEANLDLFERQAVPDPATLGAHNLILCFAYSQRARFDIAREFGREARRQYARCGSRNGELLVTTCDGLLAMAQGHAEQAQSHYERGKRIVARYYPRESGAALPLEFLSKELDLERNLVERFQSRAAQMPKPPSHVALTLDSRAAALDVVAERHLDADGARAALRAVEVSLEFASSQALVGAVRHLSALRVAYLIEDERVDQAAIAWRGAGLPEDLPDLLDLDAQSWREMEAICCARIRLLTAQDAFAPAREVAKGLSEVARKRRLARTRMRCLALWMALEYRAQRQDEASARLLEYLRAYRDTGYVRPLAKEREVGTALLESLLESDPSARIRETANAVLEQLGPQPSDHSRAQQYKDREIELLQALALGEKNKEIARRLGISEHTVHYHLKNLYRKLGAVGRVDAVRRAHVLGVMDYPNL
ncbi:MAG: LuxR C-terminal-related transcriptional regulator [Gammaproteobacteria bacterium]|nr:LuxR C-terminal-related transcriptional regulator [Gammaproteobacteria bacterium]